MISKDSYYGTKDILRNNQFHFDFNQECTYIIWTYLTIKLFKLTYLILMFKNIGQRVDTSTLCYTSKRGESINRTKIEDELKGSSYFSYKRD